MEKIEQPPAFEAPGVLLYEGDCIEVMREMPAESVHAIVTDPPYGLGFMGREWDALPPGEEFAREALRVLKPGGHIVAFGGSRTWHRLAVAIEDAGFEIRDSIAWLYASGFPKSLDVAKAIDATVLHGGSNSRRLRAAELAGDGAAYSMTGRNNGIMGETVTVERKTFEPETEAAKTWDGWGTALKPAFEPIVVGRKPLAGTVAANVLAHGTGALNVDATRIPMSETDAEAINNMGGGGRVGAVYDKTNAAAHFLQGTPVRTGASAHEAGRWPSNVVLDDALAADLDAQTGVRKSGMMRAGTQKQGKTAGILGEFKPQPTVNDTYGDEGGASRFFPVFRFEAKAPTSERPVVDGVAHPTVKPLALMRWLCRLVTPKGGTILEPFAGSGTTLEAAAVERFDVIGIEKTPEYIPLIKSRFAKPVEITLGF